ncbi:LacI family DNA-binding transcriptional regulator [Flindersiella endophytica]
MHVVTRDDVARLAGTSTAVVSYVLNNGPRPVSEATRQRVLAAVEQLGYRPNGVARSLRAQRTRVLGLIVPDISNPYFAQLARDIEDVAFGQGYTVVLGNSVGDTARELVYVRTFVESRVDGLLYISAGQPGHCVDELVRSGIPTVVLDRRVRGFNASSVTADNRGGARVATQHLIEHGHRRIAFLGGPSKFSPAAERRRGWSSQLRQAGLASDRSLVVRAAFDRNTGYRAALDVLSTADRPTALFAAADEQGIGALRAAHELGLRVPDDLAIVSFDGVVDAAYTVPSLTGVRQPVRAMAARALSILLGLVSGDDAEPVHEVFPVELILRGSCGCPERSAEQPSD